MSAGRTPKEINWDEVELFIKAGSTQKRICEYLEICKETLVDRVKIKYGMDYSAFSASLRSKGELMIEAQQYQKAMKGYWPALLWLGKIRLGQKEPEQLQFIAANQSQIDQSHIIMQLQHENETLKSLLGENDHKPETEPELLRSDTPIQHLGGRSIERQDICEHGEANQGP